MPFCSLSDHTRLFLSTNSAYAENFQRDCHMRAFENMFACLVAGGGEAEAEGKESRACAGMSGKVGTGKDVEEFRNYEDSDRHSVIAS